MGLEYFDVVVAGHICLDMMPGFIYRENCTLENIIKPGKVVNVSGLRLSTGGAVSNTGGALAVLGIRTKLIAKIGNDFMGAIVKKLLENESVSEELITDDLESTSYSIVIVPGKSDRIFLHDAGANDSFCYGDLNFNKIGKAKFFHFGYLPAMKKMYENNGEQIVEIFKKVKELGVTTCVDMSLPDIHSDAGKVDWKGILKRLLPYVDIFVPSIEETLYMINREAFLKYNEKAKKEDIIGCLDMNELQIIGDTLLDMGAKIVLVKCGKKGVYIKTGDVEALNRMGRAKPVNISDWAHRELIEEAFHVDDVKSAAGAGDTSIAGFIASYLNGRNIYEALKITCAVGSQCITAYDTLSGIRPLDETVSMIKNGWSKDHIEIKGGYWKYNNDKNVWVGKKDSALNK